MALGLLESSMWKDCGTIVPPRGIKSWVVYSLALFQEVQCINESLASIPGSFQSHSPFSSLFSSSCIYSGRRVLVFQ